MFYIHIRCQRGRVRESCSKSTSDVREEGWESHVLCPHQMSERKEERVMFYINIRCQRGRGESHVLYPHQMSERKLERVMFYIHIR